eukprot:jgi/Mesvir1/2799/Mv21744-RA.1
MLGGDGADKLTGSGGNDRLYGGSVCAQNDNGQDWGCPIWFVCKRIDRTFPGARQPGDVCVHECDASSITLVGGSPYLPATCAPETNIVAQAVYRITMGTCPASSAFLNLEALLDAIAAKLGMPRCQLSLDAGFGSIYKRRRDLLQAEVAPRLAEGMLHSTNSRRRRLLQANAPLAPNQIGLLLQASLSSDDELGAFLDIVNSGDFSGFLADFFGSLGIVADTQLMIALTLLLGSGTSDPHFVTARGDTFDFAGRPGGTYCVLTDAGARVHVNARLMAGVNDANGIDATSSANMNASNMKHELAGMDVPAAWSGRKGKDARTWMDQVGVVYGKDRVLVDANDRPGTPYAASYGTLVVNGVSYRTNPWIKSIDYIH